MKWNEIYNGGMRLFQRTDPAVATNRADDTYGPDRWNVLTQTGNATILRGSNGIVSAFNSRNYLSLNSGSDQRVGIAQIIENANCGHLRASEFNLTFSVQTDIGAVSCAVLEHAGTADSVTSDIVNNWGSDIYEAGQFFHSSVTPVKVAHFTPPASANGVSRYYVNGVLSTNFNNLIVFFWLTDLPGAAKELKIGDIGLYEGGDRQVFTPRPFSTEVAICQRYFEKSYNLDTPPGASADVVGFARGHGYPSGKANCFVQFSSPKRVAPTCHPYSYNGTIDKFNDTSGGTDDIAATAQIVGENSFAINVDTGLWAGTGIQGHWTADAEL